MQLRLISLSHNTFLFLVHIRPSTVLSTHYRKILQSVLVSICDIMLLLQATKTATSQFQWRRQDVLRGEAKLEISLWGTDGELQGPAAAAAR